MNRAPFIKLGAFVLLVTGLLLILHARGFDVIRITPMQVRTFVLSYGAWAPLMYLLAYGQPLVPLPASVMTATAGLVFGTRWGIPAALTSATLRACTQFVVARLLGQEAVEKLLRGKKLSSLYQTTGRIGFKTVFLIRIIPSFPFDVQNYALGFSEVRFAPYALATAVGMIPGTVAFVYFGNSLTDMGRFWKMMLALVLIVACVIAQRIWSAKRRAASPPRSSE